MVETVNIKMDDLAAMREIAEEGRAHALQGGHHLVGWGSAVCIGLSLTWASATGQAALLPPQYLWIVWLAVMGAAFGLVTWMGRRQAAAPVPTLTAKVECTTWSIGGGMIGVLSFGLMLVAYFSGDKLRGLGFDPLMLFAMIPPFTFSIYAIALASTAVAGRANWLWGFVALAAGFVLVTLLLVWNYTQFPVTILGVLATCVMPGAIMMRQNARSREA